MLDPILSAKAVEMMVSKPRKEAWEMRVYSFIINLQNKALQSQLHLQSLKPPIQVRLQWPFLEPVLL